LASRSSTVSAIALPPSDDLLDPMSLHHAFALNFVSPILAVLDLDRTSLPRSISPIALLRDHTIKLVRVYRLEQCSSIRERLGCLRVHAVEVESSSRARRS